MSVISQIFHKKEVNSWTIHRVFRENLWDYSAKASPYGPAKAVVSRNSAQAISIRYILLWNKILYR